MRVHNCLPLLLRCLRQWEAPPTAEVFDRDYLQPLAPVMGDGLWKRARHMHDGVLQLDWKAYRDEALRLDPAREEARLRKQMAGVEKLLGISLEGEVILFGAFSIMDGYARFDHGRHRVFLGVDESHGRGAYIDVLMSHELTHVIRESRPEVWEGWGLSLDMTNDEFTENLTVAEHLLNEGFSCAVSEILNPGEDPWHYCYQSRESLQRVLERGEDVDRVVKEEIESSDGDYGRLYNPYFYGPDMPSYTHYVWAWQWAKRLIHDRGHGDPKAIVARSAKDFVDHALQFKMRGLGPVAEGFSG